MMDVKDCKKGEMVKAMMDIEVIPNFSTETLAEKNVTKIPLAEIALAGGSLASLAETFRTVTQSFTIPVDGLFRFDSRGYTGNVARLHEDGGYLTGVFQEGKGLVGNGVYRPVDSIQGSSTAVMAIDPMMLAVAVALADVSAKLSDIQKTQAEILSVLEEDKKAAIKGNIKFLSDTLSNLKFNVDDEKFRTLRQQEVISIERESEKSIAYYRAQVEKMNDSNAPIQSDKDIAERSKKLDSLLGQYQASLFVLGFAIYIDVMLTENFSEDYLGRIASKLEQYALDYRVLYTDSYNRIEEQASSSVEAFFLGHLSAFSKFTGETIAKIPVLGDGPVDEALMGAGDSLGKINEQREDGLKSRLIVRNDSCITGFLEKIRQINQLYNQPSVYYFDGEFLYCAQKRIA